MAEVKEGIPTKVAEEAAEADKLLKDLLNEAGGESEADKEITEEGKTEELTAPEKTALAEDKDKEPPQPTAGADVQALQKELEAARNAEAIANGRLRVSAEENRALKEKLTTLESSLQRMEDQMKTLQAGKDVKPEEGKPKTEKQQYLKDEYPEIYDAIEESFQTERTQLQKAVDDLRQEITQLRTKTEVNEKRTAENDDTKYFNHLTELCPDWESIRDTTGFAEWLEVVEPYSGKQRGLLASLADQAKNVERVAQFYNDYKKEAGITTAEKKNKGKYLHPGSGGGGGGGEITDTNTKKIFSRAEVDQFYKDYNSPKWRGKEQERAIQEKEYDLAGIDGRIR